MKRIAMISNGFVFNVAMWDGRSAWKPGCLTVDVTDRPEIGPGWTYDGKTFLAPKPSTDPA